MATKLSTVVRQFEAIQPIRVLIATLACVSMLGGCRLCCDSEDGSYSAYGGAWERTQRSSGRVGSVYEPGGAQSANLVDRDAPEDSEEKRERNAADSEPEEKQDINPLDQLPEPKFETETPEEFQERLRKFKEDQTLSAEVVPGSPAPPNLKF